jgi:signal transduction histidine kinase
VALYAELDEKAGQLQRANELKTRFLSKVSQILRNFISNAFKFTERGQVRVSATLDSAQQGGVHRCRRWDRYRLR